MPSPFPGMNPYLEQDDAWHDFHERFLIYSAEVIGSQLLPNYIVKIDEHIFVHDPMDGPRRVLGRADLGIEPTGEIGRPAGAAMTEAPVEVEIPEMDEERFNYLEIRDRHGFELVTVVELLSPSNKRRGSEREQYLAKREQILNSPAHLVEIDLLRAGEPMPADDRPTCPYSATVSRSEQRRRAGFWPIQLRERLPVIPIPVRAPEPDARLDLQEILHRVYDAAGYYYYIYGGTPDPPLSKEDAAWAKAFLPAAS